MPLETFLTEQFIRKDRTPPVGCDAASFSVRSFLERCLDGEFGAEIGVDEGGRGGKSSCAAVFVSSSLLLYFTREWSPAFVLLAASVPVSDGTALTVSWFSWGLDEGECGTIAEEEGIESLLLFKIISQLAEE